jgi:hypothetical protein
VAAPPPPVGPRAQTLDSSLRGEPELPPVLEHVLSELERWAQDNRRDARHDSVRFWALKLPAILASAAAGVLGLLKLELVAAVAAAIATVCVLVDGVNPGGAVRNAHLRAVHDLRSLQQDMLSAWRMGNLRGADQTELAASLLDMADQGRHKVGNELRTAETMLGAQRS